MSVGRRRWVPGNRWDLVADEVEDRLGCAEASVAVVIPYFEQPNSLMRMYTALGAAGLDRRRHEVIVVDDGSSCPPPAPPGELDVPVRRIRQADRGCRPGAARNLGVGATTAEVLVFLDADTLPCPPAIHRLATWPEVVPDALVVGRRHHADLGDWTPTDVSDWFAGRRADPPRRADPAWLTEGYARTRDLLDADERSYRYVISGVMSCGRALFDDIGGFDAERADYGGEDWELAYRAYNNGAVLVHDRAAVAWHDEPDRAERDGPAIDQSEETLWLASRIPEPTARPSGVIYEIVGTVAVIDVASADIASLVTTIASVLAALGDVAVRVVSPAPLALSEHFRHDARVRFNPPTDAQLLRCRASVTIRAPLAGSASCLHDLVADVRRGGVGTIRVSDRGREVVTVTSTRAAGRWRRARDHGATPEQLAELAGEHHVSASAIGLCMVRGPVDLQAEFGGWAR